jgi:hypothetical protein
MLAWMEDQVGQLNVCGGTRKHYELLMVRLKEFGRLRSWSDLTVENIYLWDDWLRNMENVNARKPSREGLEVVATVSDGTVHNYHKHLKA